METIEIHSFGPITKVSLEIKRLTILIGSQGSGKSTISKLLTIFRDMFWRYSILGRKNAPLRPFIQFKIDKYFKADTYLRYTSGPIVITYQNGEFSCQNEVLSPSEQIAVLEKQIGEVCLSTTKKLGYADFNELGDKEFSFLFANCRTLLYIPAERIMASQLIGSLASIQLAQIPLGNPILEYMSFFEKAQKSTPVYEIPFLDAKFETKDGVPYVTTKDGSSLTLDSCSSGIQSALPLIMVMNYCCKEHYFDSFVVEEPEQNLFPENQKELLRLMISLWKSQSDKNANMVITTHSPYTLTCVNVEMLAHIVGQNPQYSQEVNGIISENEWLDPDLISVYALDPKSDSYATDLIDSKTKLIGVNALDSASEIIASEYNSLYKLYIKQLRG